MEPADDSNDKNDAMTEHEEGEEAEKKERTITIDAAQEAGGLATLLLSCAYGLPLDTPSYAALTLGVDAKAPAATHAGFAARCVALGVRVLGRDPGADAPTTAIALLGYVGLRHRRARLLPVRTGRTVSNDRTDVQRAADPADGRAGTGGGRVRGAAARTGRGPCYWRVRRLREHVRRRGPRARGRGVDARSDGGAVRPATHGAAVGGARQRPSDAGARSERRGAGDHAAHCSAGSAADALAGATVRGARRCTSNAGAVDHAAHRAAGGVNGGDDDTLATALGRDVRPRGTAPPGDGHAVPGARRGGGRAQS